MSEPSLHGCRVLVVEDEYFIAEELRCELDDAGAVVLGPAGSVASALELLASEPRIDAAVLDVNLRGETVFPVADALARRGIPFLFTTGYDWSAVPERYAHAPRCEKPINIILVMRAIERIIHARA